MSETVAESLKKALAAHRAGKVAEAEQIYRRILLGEPGNFDALRFWGVLLAQRGKLAEAQERLQEAVALRPESSDAHSDLGEVQRLSGDLGKAVTSFRTAVRLNPQNHLAHNNLGAVLLAQAHYLEATECYQTVVKLRPDFAEGWHGLGRAYGGRHIGPPGVAALERAAKLAPQRIDILCRLANAYVDTEQSDKAKTAFPAVFALDPNYVPGLRGFALLQSLTSLDDAVATMERALRLAPEDPDLLEVLASILRQGGAFDRAFEAYKAGIELPRKKYSTYYGLAHCRKFVPGDETLVEKIAAALDHPGLSYSDRATVHFALGKVTDDLGRYEEAISHFDEANAAYRAALPREANEPTPADLRRQLSGRVDRLIAMFDREGIDRLRKFAGMSDRPILIVGMMRSGTTLVEQILSSHPEVASGGELPFWENLNIGMPGRDDLGWLERNAAKIIERYLALLSSLSGDLPRVTDKMPNNFFSAAAVHALLPNARLIHCRRNPVDTALSIYFTRFAHYHDMAYARSEIVYFYKQYHNLIAHWRKLLPPDRFIEIDYEEMVGDQETVSRKLVEFCGLGWNDACLDFHRSTAPIRTASVWQARQPIYRTSAERWRRYEPWLGEFRDLLAEQPLK